MNICNSSSQPTYWIVIPAAGVGARMGASYPKQYLPLLDKTILEHTLDCLLALPLKAMIYIAIGEGDSYWPNLTFARHPKITCVKGGEERADSVLNCLEALTSHAKDEDWVLVHDAARPCVRTKEIMKLISEVGSHPIGGILGVPVSDTLKQVSGGVIEKTVDRSLLWQAQTPQLFRFGLLRDCLRLGLSEKKKITDEASALETYGHKPLIIEGRSDNLKVTRPEDLLIATMVLQHQRNILN